MEGDYPIGAKEDPLAPYNLKEYIKHVTVVIECDIIIEESIVLDDCEVSDKVKDIIVADLSTNCAFYDIKEITIE